MAIQQATPPSDATSPVDGNTRKRVCKACDRCRLKKSKCDGSNPCGRCKADNAICVFGERKKSQDKIYQKGYVEMLEQQQAQLVTGLHELYRRIQKGQGWIGSPLKEIGHGTPLTHDILERLGALKQDGHASNESFEEDVNLMQQRLIANGARFMQRQPSSEGESSGPPSPCLNELPLKPVFPDPFSLSRFPPTPPNQSPFPRSGRISSPTKAEVFAQPQPTQSPMNTALLQQQAWNNPPMTFGDNMDFLIQTDSPQGFDTMSPQFNRSQLPLLTMNPCLTMKDWAVDDDFQRFFNPTLM